MPGPASSMASTMVSSVAGRGSRLLSAPRELGAPAGAARSTGLAGRLESVGGVGLLVAGAWVACMVVAPDSIWEVGCRKAEVGKLDGGGAVDGTGLRG